MLLFLPKNTDGISILPFVSPWGETDELLCSFEGTLIGQVFNDDRRPNTNIILLVPKLDQRRNYPFPSFDAFLQALLTLLRGSSPIELACERDADQDVVVQLTSRDDVETALKHLLDYCTGEALECPTFIYIRP